MAAIPEVLRTRRVLSMTYDDGPSQTLTRAVAEILESHTVRGTFFMLGSRALVAPTVADELPAAGHEIGCHGALHVHAWRVSTEAAIEDIEQGYRDLERWISKQAVFRPPYGKLLPGTRRAAIRGWGPVGWWRVDSDDTWPSFPAIDEVVDRVIGDGGGVALMHDFERASPGAEAVHGYVLELTKSLIRTSVRHGPEIRPLGALLSD